MSSLSIALIKATIKRLMKLRLLSDKKHGIRVLGAGRWGAGEGKRGREGIKSVGSDRAIKGGLGRDTRTQSQVITPTTSHNQAKVGY